MNNNNYTTIFLTTRGCWQEKFGYITLQTKYQNWNKLFCVDSWIVDEHVCDVFPLGRVWGRTKEFMEG